MRVVLTDNTKSPTLFAAMVAVDPNVGRDCRGLNIQVPGAADEAGNANVVIKIGAAKADGTDVDQPEILLREGDSYNYPPAIKNSISLAGRNIHSSLNNGVVYINPVYA